MKNKKEYFEFVAKVEKLREEREKLTDKWNDEVAWSSSEEIREKHIQKEKELAKEIKSLETTMKAKRAGFSKDELREMAQEWRAKSKEEKSNYLS